MASHAHNTCGTHTVPYHQNVSDRKLIRKILMEKRTMKSQYYISFIETWKMMHCDEVDCVWISSEIVMKHGSVNDHSTGKSDDSLNR
ncbi:uncharacterized protein [Nicotiana tomentosiformis]|uniref:uncharacterized protein n=1 Tax=Nicotiana tomentosiformis TaxID=4098 RepID=UPI00388CE9A1